MNKLTLILCLSLCACKTTSFWDEWDAMTEREQHAYLGKVLEIGENDD